MQGSLEEGYFFRLPEHAHTCTIHRILVNEVNEPVLADNGTGCCHYALVGLVLNPYATPSTMFGSHTLILASALPAPPFGANQNQCNGISFTLSQPAYSHLHTAPPFTHSPHSHSLWCRCTLLHIWCYSRINCLQSQSIVQDKRQGNLSWSLERDSKKH